MAQTVGTRAGNAHRGDFLVTCAYCGAVWYRSKCRRNAAGQLVCPDDQHIRDPVTLSRLNAARSSRLRSRKVDGGSADREALTTAGPLVITSSTVVTGWEASSGVALATGGRVSAWTAISGGLTLVQATTANQPRLKTDGPSGRSYVSFEGAQLLDESTGEFVRPAPSREPTFYWAVVRQPQWVNTGVWWGFESVDAPGVSLMLAAFSLSDEPDTIIKLNGIGAGVAAMPKAQFKRVEVGFTASSADYLKIGTNVNMEGSAGDNTPSDDFTVGGLAPFFNAYLDICELWILKAVPSATELSRLDDYARAKYGSAVLL